MIQDVTDPNIVLDWNEGVRETDMTVKLVPEETFDGDALVHDLIEFGANISDYTTENFDKIVQSDEIRFVEYLSHLYIISKESKMLLGKLCWQRLQNALGWMDANESERRNSMISAWCHKINCEYRQLNNYILAAKAQELLPDVSDMTITAQAELAQNAGDSEEEQRETLRERAENVRELDPELANTTATAREVKQIEANGNKQPKLYKMKDLSEFQHTDDEIVMGQIKVGEKFDEESGSYEDIYEYKPVLGIYWYMSDTGENEPQFENYKKMLARRLGVKNA